MRESVGGGPSPPLPPSPAPLGRGGSRNSLYRHFRISALRNSSLSPAEREREAGGVRAAPTHAALAFLLVALCAGAARAQSPGVPTRPLGPGDPLPPFHLEYGASTIRTSPTDGTRIEINGGGTFTMGDLRLTADHLVVLRGYQHIEATGHVVLTRGDESLDGSSFVLDADTATLTADEATLSSTPLFLHADRITRSPDGTTAEKARIVFGDGDGRGELQVLSRSVTLSTDRKLRLVNAEVILYGIRLFTLPRLTVNVAPRRSGSAENRLSLPVQVRDSRVSGFVVGINLAFTPYPRTAVRVVAEETAREGPELLLSARRTIFSRGVPSARRTFQLQETAPGESSPLRQLLTARPAPPAPDPVLDFGDILPTPNPLAAPTHSAGTDLHADFSVSHHQEIGYRRQGPLLLSRQPEISITGQVPLVETAVPSDDRGARQALRAVRVSLVGDIGTGNYSETRLLGGRASIRRARLSATAGVVGLPLLVGNNLLLQTQSVLHTYRYQHGGAYGYLETSLDSDYVFAQRTALGASYISRVQRGKTPFYFDQVDTRDEGQIRGESALGHRRQYTLAALGRYDVAQHRFFDYEISAAVRGYSIEPRISFRRLNRQVLFGVALPGFTSP